VRAVLQSPGRVMVERAKKKDKKKEEKEMRRKRRDVIGR
jgi:hypothetical protein